VQKTSRDESRLHMKLSFPNSGVGQTILKAVPGDSRHKRTLLDPSTRIELVFQFTF
jgi:hypothetical protein